MGVSNLSFNYLHCRCLAKLVFVNSALINILIKILKVILQFLYNLIAQLNSLLAKTLYYYSFNYFCNDFFKADCKVIRLLTNMLNRYFILNLIIENS